MSNVCDSMSKSINKLRTAPLSEGERLERLKLELETLERINNRGRHDYGISSKLG
jgi:hypothetical protein